MSKRISPTLSITMRPEVIKRLKERSEENTSRQIASDLQTFYSLLDAISIEMKGYFTTAEACYLCDVFNGTLMDPSHIRYWPEQLAWNVEDGAELCALNKKWETDDRALSEKLRSLTPAQAVWVWDRVQAFWRDPNRKPIREIVKELFLT